MGQIFDIDIYGNERQERITLILTPPFRATGTKHLELCRLFNYLGDAYLYAGRLSLSGEGLIRYKAVIDTDDLEPSPAMMHNLLGDAIALFERHIEPVAAIALTQKNFDEVLAEYEKKEALEASSLKEDFGQQQE